MRVHISVDMEGVAGLATLDQIIRGGSGYPRAQALMTAETNAAIRGAFDGGATEVVVSDSHGTMDNLLHADLDARATVVFGKPRPSCMLQGLTRADDVVLFVGYHAAAGAHGVLSHTFSSSFTTLRVNGKAVSEAEVNALYAASRGVPVGMLSGDDQICTTAAEVFPGAQVVQVKSSVGWASAESVSPAVACARLEEAAAMALAAPAPVLRVPDELVLEIDYGNPLMADFASCVPGTQRISALTTQIAVTSADDLLKAIMASYYLASIAAGQIAAIAQRR